MRLFALIAALLIAPLIAFVALNPGVSTPAFASFHFMRIYGVMGGAEGSASKQFVELRQASGGQNEVQNAQICFYDADGVPWAKFVFPSMVAHSGEDGSILIGSQAMEDAWSAGAELDFVFGSDNTTALALSADVNAPIPQPAGAMVYESKATDTACGSPDPIDSIAYGTGYNGAAFYGTKFDHDLPTDGSGFQLTQTPVVFPPTNNSTEYAATLCIVARNDAGQEGTVDEGCATPTPTPTPSPSPTSNPTSSPTPTASPSGTLQGDADCNGSVNTADGVAVLKGFGGVDNLPCPARANVNCDSAVDPQDALAIVKFDSGISSASAGCTPIGQPLPN